MCLDIRDQIIGDTFHLQKSIYVLAFQEGSVIEEKIRRICSSFQGDTFETKYQNLNQEINEAIALRVSTRDIISETKRVFRQYLVSANQYEGNEDVSVFKIYKVLIMREKAIYTHLNMLI
jgi:hypothetical protein